MMRSVTYRQALNGFLFTGLWLVFGAIVLWSPAPGALGIGGAMFAAWVLLFFASMAVSGILLTIAALNGAFPPRAAAQRRNAAGAARKPGDPLWAPRTEGPHPASSARREG
ncbi:MAG: hypothetical protein WD359_04055 [Dehalococcoidia bacterium]